MGSKAKLLYELAPSFVPAVAGFVACILAHEIIDRLPAASRFRRGMRPFNLSYSVGVIVFFAVGFVMFAAVD
jgi:hypothetical protein